MSSKNILTLSSASIASQFITILGTLITARLFLPDDFGQLAFFFSLITLLTILGTLEYHRVISITEKDENSFIALNLVAKLLFFFGLFLLIILFFFDQFLIGFIGNKINYYWLYLLPVTLFASALFQSFSLLLNRFSLYKELAVSRVFLAFVVVLLNVAFGIYAVEGGLIFGTTVGTFLAFLLIFSISYRVFEKKIFQSNTKSEKKLSKDYINHPKHLTPSVMFGSTAEQIPIFIFFLFFDLKEAGFYAMATRVIYLPLTLIANAVGEVYRQEIFDAFRTRGSFEDVHYRTLKKTIFMALFIPILYPLLPVIFEIALGSEWIPAAKYSQILLISLFFQFIITPLDKSSLLVGATRYIFFWQFSRFFLNLFAVAAIYLFQLTAVEYLYWLVAVNILLYLVEGYAQLQFAKTRNIIEK